MRPLLLLDPGPLSAPVAADYAARLIEALPPSRAASRIAVLLPATAVMTARSAVSRSDRPVSVAVRADSALSAAVAIDAGAGLIIAAAPLVVPGAPLLSELRELPTGPGASDQLAATVRASFGEPLLLHLPLGLDAAARAAIAGVVRAAGGRGIVIAADLSTAEAAIAEGSVDGALIDVAGLSPEAAGAVVVAFDRAVRLRHP